MNIEELPVFNKGTSKYPMAEDETRRLNDEEFYRTRSLSLLPKSLKRTESFECRLNFSYTDSLKMTSEGYGYLMFEGCSPNSIVAELAKFQKAEDLMISSIDLDSVPAELGRLQELRRLDLHGNNLESLPEELSALQKLGTLILFANKFKEPPEVLEQLPNLEYLDLYRNQIRDFPESIGRLQYQGDGRYRLPDHQREFQLGF